MQDPASPHSPLPSKRRRPAMARLGLWGASLLIGLCSPPTALALAGGAPTLALGGAALVALGAGLGLAVWSRRSRARRLGGVTAALAAAVVAALVSPIPRSGRPAAPIRSLHLPGERGGTPWFAGLPEQELVRLGEQVGWRPHEAATVARQGGVAERYPAFEPLFQRPESVVLDSWLTDRGHYYAAAPPDPQAPGGRPLLVFLHGSAGNFRAYAGWVAPPALAAGFVCVFPTWGFGTWPTERLARRVQRVVEDAATRLGADPQRVVIVGLSAGALAACRLVERAPQRFCGAAAISGAPASLNASACAQVPWLLVHGAQDGHLPVTWSRQAAAALEAAGATVRYREAPEADHTLFLVERRRIVADVVRFAEQCVAGR